jgi:hypothetical protein
LPVLASIVPIGEAAILRLAAILDLDFLGNLGIVPPQLLPGGRVHGIDHAPAAGDIHDAIDHQWG